MNFFTFILVTHKLGIKYFVRQISFTLHSEWVLQKGWNIRDGFIVMMVSINQDQQALPIAMLLSSTTVIRSKNVSKTNDKNINWFQSISFVMFLFSMFHDFMPVSTFPKILEAKCSVSINVYVQSLRNRFFVI